MCGGGGVPGMGVLVGGVLSPGVLSVGVLVRCVLSVDVLCVLKIVREMRGVRFSGAFEITFE